MAAGEWALRPHPAIPRITPAAPLAVVVLDGWGEARADAYNAIAQADTPCMDGLKKGAPRRWRLLKAHGTAVGLPTDDDMGNSEVGHNAMGSGQVVDQGARLVDKALASGHIFEQEGWQHIEPAFSKHTVHFIGLLSDGGVHSRYDQLLGLLNGDGTSVKFMAQLEGDLARLRQSGCDARVASGGGRMRVTMDRYESDWDIVKRGYYAHVLGEAPRSFTDPLEAVRALREPKQEGGKPISDQWLEAFAIVDDKGKPVGAIQDDDAVVIFNFRADRVVELAMALEYPDFAKFNRKRFPKTRLVGLVEYDGELHLPKHYLVPPPHISRTTGEFLARNGVSTFACSESQKIGHVTFFWNGNRSGYFNEKLEMYKEIRSDQGIPFSDKPVMKAPAIANAAIEALRSGKYDQVRVNFPNGDMVGHTGDLGATVAACTAADKAVKELLDCVEELGGRWLVTADHGNAEDMVQRDKKTGQALMEDGRPRPLSSHTLNPVPCTIGGPGLPQSVAFREDMKEPGLASVGPTIINLLGFEAPDHMVPTLLKSDT